jgi:SEC-C motif-containing protein
VQEQKKDQITDCPCRSGLPYSKCCEPFVTGSAVPDTAEKTMRSRYTAYATGEIAYLMTTLHPSNREEGDEENARHWAERSEWLGLDIVATDAGGPADSEGVVEFIARFRDKKGDVHAHHEISRFVKEDGRWLFREGHAPEQAPVRNAGPKVGRNDPCPCGSGKKYKKCCGANAV